MIRACVAVLAALVCAMGHAAYPDKPIQLIVPWAPGGSTDAIARAIAQRMTQSMGQPVLVDNRAGASGQIGTSLVTKAAPDGYTIGIVELPHAIAQSVFPKLPYDLLRDFAPITLVGSSPLVLFTSASKYRNGDIKAFLADAHRSKAPLALAHSGAGSISNLEAVLLGSENRLNLTAVPYKGSAPALIDVASGIVDGHFATLASGSPLLSAGKVSALVVTSASRLPELPDAPTAREVGIRGIDADQWWGLVAPVTTPIPVLEKLRAEVAAAIADPIIRQRLNALGIQLRTSSRDEFRTFLRSEVGRWGDVVRKANVRAE